eukprot:TRINITY_DN55584_c0_g1_i5.p1 TRINITY_DN55584_c0_g1~~TRINITY_DN55584_c0_g1_i5.p1  ORF type:complete len:258 (-),score=28.68 TRINITY_DN55584_c0_g1_i5:457-1230(-)
MAFVQGSHGIETAMFAEAAMDSEMPGRRMLQRGHPRCSSMVGRAYGEIDAFVGAYMVDTTSHRDYMWTAANAQAHTRSMSVMTHPMPQYNMASAYEPAEEMVGSHFLSGQSHSSTTASRSTAASASHAPPRGDLTAAAPGQLTKKPPTRPLHRPLRRLSRSNSPQLQAILRAVAQRLCSVPDRRAQASWLGQCLDAGAKQWLRDHELRLVTVLKHHADDFLVISAPDNVTAVFLQKTADKTFSYATQMFSNVKSVSL